MGKAVTPREIRRKIRSVQNMRKITKAMKMVSAAKLRKVQGRLLAIRPYSDKLKQLLQDLFARASDVKAPLLEPRPKVRKIAYVVVTADKGLAGSFNANMIRLALKTVQAEPRAVVYTIGKKGADAFRRKGYAAAGHWQGLPADLGLKQVREIASTVIGAYRKEEVDEVHILYTEYVNAVTFRPRAVKFLPFEAAKEVAGAGKDKAEGTGTRAGTHAGTGTGTRAEAVSYIFEPGPQEILAQLIPRYVEVLFYRLLLETLASEHSARMAAMQNASDNATKIIGQLTLSYNKARQAAITKELLDIVGGAEALKG